MWRPNKPLVDFLHRICFIRSESRFTAWYGRYKEQAGGFRPMTIYLSNVGVVLLMMTNKCCYIVKHGFINVIQ